MPHTLRIDAVTLTNYRCFEFVNVPLHPQLTVLYAENAGGKTALLNALAVALGAGDVVKRYIHEGEIREVFYESGTLVPQYPCEISASGWVAGEKTEWSRSKESAGGKTTTRGSVEFRKHLRSLLARTNANWPVIAFYGTHRLANVASSTKAKVPKPGRRLDGYVDALDPRAKDGQLRQWLFDISLADIEKRSVPTFEAFREALRTAAAHPRIAGDVTVSDVRFSPHRRDVVVELSNGEVVPWDRLSDGYRVFLGLVADLARRCVTLNPQLGKRAVREAEGVVLVDEVDLSLHPRWQRVVLRRLVEAFPRLQFVVSTHSPQVVSSVQNDQVVGLLPERIIHPVAVAGRDTNSILRDVFDTPERDPESKQAQMLTEFYRALDKHALATAQGLLDELHKEWGDTDPEIVRAERLLEWARDETNS